MYDNILWMFTITHNMAIVHTNEYSMTGTILVDISLTRGTDQSPDTLGVGVPVICLSWLVKTWQAAPVV